MGKYFKGQITPPPVPQKTQLYKFQGNHHGKRFIIKYTLIPHLAVKPPADRKSIFFLKHMAELIFNRIIIVGISIPYILHSKQFVFTPPLH